MYPPFYPPFYLKFTPIYTLYTPNIPDKGEIIVEAVESSRQKVQAEHLLVLEDSLAQGDGCLVLHVDAAAEHQLEGLSDEDDGDCVIRVLATSVPTGRHKHTLETAQDK